MIEAEFFLELLMGLLADPARFDGARQVFDRRIGGQVREVIFTLSAGAMFPDQPNFFAGHVLGTHSADTLRRTVRHPDPDGGEACRETSLGAAPPTDLAPLYAFEHCLDRDRFAIRDVTLPRSTAVGHRENQSYIGGIDLLAPRNAHRPGEPAFAQRLTEGGAQSVARVREHATEAHARRLDPVDLLDRHLRLGSGPLMLFRYAGTLHPCWVAHPALRQEEP